LMAKLPETGVSSLFSNHAMAPVYWAWVRVVTGFAPVTGAVTRFPRLRASTTISSDASESEELVGLSHPLRARKARTQKRAKNRLNPGRADLRETGCLLYLSKPIGGGGGGGKIIKSGFNGINLLHSGLAALGGLIGPLGRIGIEWLIQGEAVNEGTM
jgi:hypothetical protein